MTIHLNAGPSTNNPATTPVQPYSYRFREPVEPEWRRFPGWSQVTADEWDSAQWQRANCVKSARQLGAVLGPGIGDSFLADLVRDQQQRATMSMLVTPQLLNTMVPHLAPGEAGFLDALYADPVRRYMIPVFSDRDPRWPSHPFATRDSLHESEMWAVEGLTHRYPTKVLAELVPTCPQYCGHCTRMDLVGNPTPQFTKHRFDLRPADRLGRMLEFLRTHPSIRDVVVSGGDLANLPWPRLESFLTALLDIPNIRDIRLATKGLVGLPQHWLQKEVLDGLATVCARARRQGVQIAVHTHANAAQSVTTSVARATTALFEAGVRDVRNQGVLMRGVNDSVEALLDLSFGLLDGAGIMPYYFYLCDMIPNSEHWRVALWEAQALQRGMMGYLPGFATPRIVCDVPFVGKRWVDQVDSYDRQRGISYWTKNYLTPLEAADPAAGGRAHPYYDPIPSLPPEGQEWWKKTPHEAH
ncbi:KamA family radical SAM protein [Kitasatospora sp. NPDC004614]|uniref:KamA family radical SAM protein n=1 Tax=unclassified Kitasatospora TaxID=2633591 RepID=UPI00368CF9E3